MRRILCLSLIGLIIAGVSGCSRDNGPPPSTGADTVQKCYVYGFTKGPYSYTHQDGTDFRYTPPKVLTGRSGNDCDKITAIGEDLRIEIRDSAGHAIHLPIDIEIIWYSDAPCWKTNGTINGQATCSERGSVTVTTGADGIATVPLLLQSGAHSTFPQFEPQCSGATAQTLVDCGVTLVSFCIRVARTKPALNLCTAEWYTVKPKNSCIIWISEIRSSGACPLEAAAQSQSEPWEEFPPTLNCHCDRTIWADADQDGDVDQADFGAFQNCFGLAAIDECRCYARDGRVIGQNEYLQFLPCISGPTISSLGCE